MFCKCYSGQCINKPFGTGRKFLSVETARDNQVETSRSEYQKKQRTKPHKTNKNNNFDHKYRLFIDKHNLFSQNVCMMQLLKFMHNNYLI